MIAARILSCGALALGAFPGCGPVLASDPWPDPLPIARDTPAFRAPAEIPPEDAVEEPPAPEPATPLALQDALDLALARSPDLAVFAWEVRASEARQVQAGKPPNPELDIRIAQEDTSGQSGQEEDAPRRVILRQELELGAKARRRAAVAASAVELAGSDYEAMRIEVAATVADRFAAVLGAQRRVASFERAVAFFEEARQKVLGLVETGALRAVEIHEVTRHLGLVRIDLQGAEHELSAARSSLAATWGNPSPQFTEAVGDLDDLRPLPDLDTVIDLARQSPAITRWDAELRGRQAALALAKAGRVPDMTYGVGVRWDNEADERGYLIDLQIDLPILDRKQGDIREAHYELARARSGQQAAEMASGEAIAELYHAAAESRARALTLGQEVVPAVRATCEAFQLGLEKLTGRLDDLFDAHRDLAQVEAQHIDALVDHHRAVAALEGLVGHPLAEAEVD